MLVILVLGGGEGLEQVAHHQFKASLDYRFILSPGNKGRRV